MSLRDALTDRAAGMAVRVLRVARVARLLAWSVPFGLVAAVSAQAQRSHAMAVGCRVRADSPAERRRADQWVRSRLKAFLPGPDQALRMRSLEAQAEQLKLAWYGISSTCQQYVDGTLAQADADLALSGFEETIANFLHDRGNDALVLAGRGQVSDMDRIRMLLTDIGVAGRQAALQGDEILAEEARQQMVNALVTFSRSFQEACYDQSFEPWIATALERQNELESTGIDVTPCANREFTAEGSGADIVWRFKHCGIGVGQWQITTTGPLQGSGIGSVGPDLTGAWYVDEDNTERDVKVRYSGKFSIVRKPPAKPDVPEPDRVLVQATESSVSSGGEVFRSSLSLSGFSFVVKQSDRPCRVEDTPGR